MLLTDARAALRDAPVCTSNRMQDMTYMHHTSAGQAEATLLTDASAALRESDRLHSI
jgi:hypothetical protein